MKKIFLFILLFTTSITFAQVSVSSSHIGRLKELKQEKLDKIKKTKTIFLLSNIYSKEEYQKVLKESWTVTNFEVLHFKDFDINNYPLDEYSFAVLGGNLVTVSKKNGSYTLYYTYVDFFMFDSKDKAKEINKYKEMSLKKKSDYDILEKDREHFALFYLLPNNDFLTSVIIKSPIDYISGKAYNEDVFYNFKLGYLKNYFQFISNKLKNNESYWIYQTDTYTDKIKDLKTQTLYVPSYVIKHLIKEEGDVGKVNEKLNDFFKDYSHKYELIEEEEINKKILNNEQFYYLRYARINTEKFLQIVDSKSGDVVYTNYKAGFGLAIRLKPKHIEEISKTIDKAK